MADDFVPDQTIVQEVLGRLNIADLDSVKALLADARAKYDEADRKARSYKFAHDTLADLLSNLGTKVVKIAKPRGPKGSKVDNKSAAATPAAPAAK